MTVLLKTKYEVLFKINLKCYKTYLYFLRLQNISKYFRNLYSNSYRLLKLSLTKT